MSYVVTWTAGASEGLERAYFFLAEKSDESSRAAVKALREHALLLENFPNAGRPVDDFDPEYRELLIPFGGAGYVMMYEIMGDCVYIVAVQHQKEAGY